MLAYFKRSLTRSFPKLIAVLLSPLYIFRNQSVPVLMYHRVTGDSEYEFDIPFGAFERQIAFITKNYDVISLSDALRGRKNVTIAKSACVLTFDDAYEDFYLKVFPLVKDLALPVTLYVPTGFIDDPRNTPVSSVQSGYEYLKPCSWDMLREMQSCSLISLAAHSHTHREFPLLGLEEISNEILESKIRFEAELGMIPQHFAYPRGAWNEVIESHISDNYESVSIVGGGAWDRELNPERLARIPIGKSDNFIWFVFKLRGMLKFEDSIKAKIKYFLN